MQSGQQPALSYAYLDNPGESPVSVSVEQLKRDLAVVLPGRDQFLLLAEPAQVPFKKCERITLSVLLYARYPCLRY
jgi:hypothetical protein